VTMLVDGLPAKAKALLGLVMNAAMLYALWFCTWGGFVYIGANEGTYGELVKIPYYCVIASIVFACLAMAVMILCEMAQQVRILSGRGER
jgi:TRAP-type C4-dicarboxylate transport system permease small subunit